MSRMTWRECGRCERMTLMRQAWCAPCRTEVALWAFAGVALMALGVVMGAVS